MDHNQIQEKEIQEKSQPLPDSSDEIRHKRKNERFAVISLIFGGLALLFEPFIGPFVALVFVLILYILGYILGFTEIPLFGRESIFDDSYGIFLSIVAYGIIAFICILSFFSQLVELCWRGKAEKAQIGI